jgi:hypothetical protein
VEVKLASETVRLRPAEDAEAVHSIVEKGACAGDAPSRCDEAGAFYGYVLRVTPDGQLVTVEDSIAK